MDAQQEKERRLQMKGIRLFGWMLLMAAAFTISSCERRPLEYEIPETALIPVKIDWSRAGFQQAGNNNENYVHRVSIRFFPKDGSPAFDRYLEVNINEGEINVPLGSYSVVIFNESVYDVYWQDAIRFTDIDNYSKFAANNIEDDKSLYDYFTFAPGERLIVEPKRLASWSLDNFKVTEAMITRTRAKSITKAISRADEEMVNALIGVVMRPLTYQAKITAEVQNLLSAQKITGLQRGYASKVYMASAETDNLPASYAFVFNGRKWTNAAQTHGTTEKSFLTFGILPTSVSNPRYMLDVDVLLANYERYSPATPLTFDVTDKVHASIANDSDHTINVDISFDLPNVGGGIYVGGWDDETIEIK